MDTTELFEPDPRDWLRLLGGVLLALGAAVLYVRKFEAWGEFLKFLVVLIPCVVLYGLGWLGGLRDRGDGVARPEGWQIAFLILGALLSGFVVAQVFLMLGADDVRASLHQMVIAAAIAATAYAASFLRNIPFLSIIGGLAALWAWLSLWDKILDLEKIGTARAFLLIFAALMLAGAIALRAAGRAQTSDFVTVAGITALLAGLLSVSNLTGQLEALGDEETKPTELWNVFVLAVSLGLIAYGSKAPSRGPGYVGAVGLVAFVGLTGANVVALASGHFDDREKLAGWPLLLLVLGIAALAASFFMPRAGTEGRGPTTAPGGVPGGPRPGAGHEATQQWPQQPQPPQQGGSPAGDQTVARPVPPPPPNDPGRPPGQ